MRIIFMGTPDIAEVALNHLLREGHEVVAVYTREDKPVGRKQVLTSPPVKLRAVKNRIPVYQPKSLKDPGEAGRIATFEADLIVVVAYGRLLPPEVLALPRFGCINLHVSLLPKYRGAAPIQWALINGDKETGVSIMQLDEGLDTGPVLAQEKIEIPPVATAGEMFELVGSIGARLLAQTVSDIELGRVQPKAQQGEVTLAPPLTKAMAGLDFTRPALELYNLIRGCNPWPLAWFDYGGKRIKVLRALPADECGAPGTIARVSPFTVCCGDASLVLENVVPQGARAMTGAEWAAGQRFSAGDSLL